MKTYNLADERVLKNLLKQNGFRFSKALGQNFIVDPEVCPKMARACGADAESAVIEIGPGAGALTAELAKIAKKVVAVELDSRLLPVLKETLKDFNNIEIINRDVLKTDIRRLVEDKFDGEPVFVCANLPYYITSPIIMKLLEERAPIKAATLMVQKEAGERICAPVGSRLAGAVTAAVDYYARAEKLFDVPAGSFEPAPKADGVVIKLNVREKPAVGTSDEKLFFRIVKAAFGQRRKTAANSIGAGTGVPKKIVESAIEALGLPATTRAENLNMNQLSDLCDKISHLLKKR